MHKLFITGTDTNIGKTRVAVDLLNQFKLMGLRTIGLKPIASGAKRMNGKLYNDDALSLQKAATVSLPYATINPVVFEPPIAPHLAAEEINVSLSANLLLEKIQPAFTVPADICLIEGAGGLHVPLNTTETMVDFIKMSQSSVILVVGIKLGCLNHAILTANAISAAKLPLAGWIANCIEKEDACTDANIATLKQWLPASCLGVVPFSPSRSVTDWQDLDPLLEYVRIAKLEKFKKGCLT